MSSTEEELAVLLHASQLGRTDIVQQAIASLKTIVGDADKVIAMVSASRQYKVDNQTEAIGTPLHVAAKHGHSDVVRALLVEPPIYSLLFPTS